MAPPPRPSLASKRRALRGQIRQQLDVLDRLPDPLLQVTGRKGRIKWANRAAREVFGPDLFDGKLADFLPAKPLKTALKTLKSDPETVAELIVQPSNQRGRDFQVRLIRLEAKSPFGARVLVALSDVTELLRSQTQRTDFIAHASHELKTPVAALSGLIETLEHDPSALPTFLPLMTKETARMRALTGGLLDLAKTEMQTDAPPQEVLAVEPLIAQSLDALALAVQNRRQTIRRQAPSVNAWVRGDPVALGTALTNLLQNAIAYSPEGSTIQVDTRVEDQEVWIRVEDQGPGIAAKHLPRLTERFYRADAGRDAKHGGTGLGLAIVKHILLRHHGRLLIDSTPGQGSCFTLVLPLHAEPPRSGRQVD